MRKFILASAILALPGSLWALDSMYCSVNSGFIQLGMTEQDVKQDCGQPLAQRKSNSSPTQKVPVTQYIFNNKGTGTAFYGVWKLKTGYGGVRLEVDVVDNKVISTRINGNDSNSFSVCGVSIQVGDPESTVLNNCGNPSMVNHTFIETEVPGEHKSVEWLYQQDQYSKPFILTFTDGKLQSIDQ